MDKPPGRGALLVLGLAVAVALCLAATLALSGWNQTAALGLLLIGVIFGVFVVLVLLASGS